MDNNEAGMSSLYDASGGPAFPGVNCNSGNTITIGGLLYHQSGMMLIDYVACQFASAIVSRAMLSPDALAKWAYERAAAMISERNKWMLGASTNTTETADNVKPKEVIT